MAADRMKKAYYERANQVVGAVIREWDPYSLLAVGAPNDEYDSEIAAVVSLIARIKTETAAAEVLSRVLSSAFEGLTPEKCMEAGRKLFAALSANGFIA